MDTDSKLLPPPNRARWLTDRPCSGIPGLPDWPRARWRHFGNRRLWPIDPSMERQGHSCPARESWACAVEVITDNGQLSGEYIDLEGKPHGFIATPRHGPK